MPCAINVPELKQKISQTIEERVARGEDVDAVAWDAVRSHLNIERAGVNTDVEGVLRLLTEVMDDHTQAAKGGVRSYQRTIELAREHLAIHGQRGDLAESLVKRAENVDKLEAELLGARVYRNRLAEEIDSLVKRARAGDTAALTQLADRVPEALKVHAATDRIQTAAARGVSQGNIIAGNVKVDWDLVGKAAKDALTKDGLDAKRFLAQLDLAGGDALSQIGLLQRFEMRGRSFVSKLWGIHNEIWINGILGPITTQSANFVSNVVQTFLLPVAKIAGGAVTLNPTAVGRGVRDVLNLTHSIADVFDLSGRAARAGIDSTATAVGKSLWHETPLLDSMFKAGERTDRRVIRGENFVSPGNPIGGLIDAAGAVIRMPTRLLTTSDELFKQINYRATLRSMAFEEAERAGLMQAGKHAELTAFVDDYMRQAFDGTGLAKNEAALQAAQRATFTQELVGKLAQDVSSLIGKHPALRPVIPFVRTPINIMREFWQYAPGLNFLQGEFRQALFGGDKLAKAQAAGKLAIGAAGTYMLFQAASSGQITGGGPANPKQRETLMATGWRPYSVVITNDDGTKEYVDYRRIDPAATLIGLAADMVEVSHHVDDPDYHGMFNGIVMSVANNVTSKTYLRGLSELVTVLGSKDPDKVEKVLTDRVGSYVPGYVASMNDDPHLRELRTWTDALRRRVPGYSKDLPPRRDMFGDPVNVPVGFSIDGEPENGTPRVSPFGYSKRVGDPVKEELAAVAMATPGRDHGFDKPPKQLNGLDLTRFRNESGQDAYDRYQELHGVVQVKGKTLPQALERLISSAFYQNLPDPSDPTLSDAEREGRLRAIRSVMTTYREAARKQLLEEFPDIHEFTESVHKAHRLQRSPSIGRLLSY